MNLLLVLLLAFVGGCRTHQGHEASSVLEADPKAVMTVIEDNSEEVLKGLQLKMLTWEQIDLNRQGARLGTESLSGMHNIKYPGGDGFTWNSGDGLTFDWYPQGITGLRSNGRHMLVVSWYGKNAASGKGVRLSFVDEKTLKYRHVLLVESAGDGKVKPLHLHAGGVAVVWSKIYVADTTRGVRMFDANKIFEVNADESKESFGHTDDGKFAAHGYLYVMPQIKSFTTTGRRFSYLAMDWTDTDAPLLISGNYKEASDKAADLRRVHAWKMNGEDVGALKWDSHNTYGVEAPVRVQGAATYNGYVFMAASGGKAKLHVGKIQSNDFKIKVFSLPHGIEDIYLDPSTYTMWSHTEHPGTRFVFSFNPKKYIEDWEK